MRVLTYNMCGSRARRNSRHVDEIAAVIRDLEPDVVGLQEVYQLDGGDARADQPRRLADLTGLQSCFWPHLYLRSGSYGNAILTRGEVGEAAMYRLPGRMLQLRALLEAQLKIDAIEVEFLCTHLVHFGPLMSRPRGRQVAEIVRLISSLRRPRILVGDLNTGWNRLDLSSLERSGLRPVCGREQLTYPARRPRLCLDHIFASAEWRCLEVRAIRTAVSDHLPVLAVLIPAPTAVGPGPVGPPGAASAGQQRARAIGVKGGPDEGQEDA
jgi:endonuclease/exonuclease/phosphatase family metal-dependent hydrolase